jgi:hypothetical protein
MAKLAHFGKKNREKDKENSVVYVKVSKSFAKKDFPQSNADKCRI